MSARRILLGAAIATAVVGCAFKDEAPVPTPGPRRALEPTLRFAVIGDYGVHSPDEAAVASMVQGWNPDLVITTGDNNYPDGAASTIDLNIGQYYSAFISPYLGQYGTGAVDNDFFPSLGNHDWVTPNAQAYVDYFSLPGNERYYDVVRGDVHLFALDSDPHEPDGVTSDSIQATWLRGALAASTARWKIVYFHHPPYSSGPHGSTWYMQWPFHDWGADVVLSGHDHLYERFDKGGVPCIVNGVGGNAERYTFGAPLQDSVVRFNSSAGAMLVEADSSTLTLSFYSVGAPGGALIDRVSLPAVTASPRGQASNDAVNDYYSLSDARAFTWRRVYIDTDNSTATGFTAGGVGADFLVENAWLYRHTGGGWSWAFVGSAGMTITGDTVGWTVSRAAIGQTAFPNIDALAFEVATPGFQNFGRVEQVYSGTAPPVTAPATDPISGASADNDATTIHYHATFAAPFTYKHVFIDADASKATGYAYGGVGAEYLIENATLYRHAGAGWTWGRMGVLTVSGGPTGDWVWTLPRATVGETAASGETADIVFHGSGGGAAEYATPPYHEVYTQSP